jgi:hypothetical protein
MISGRFRIRAIPPKVERLPTCLTGDGLANRAKGCCYPSLVNFDGWVSSMPLPAAAVFVRELIQATTLAKALQNTGLFAKPIDKPTLKAVLADAGGIKGYVERWYQEKKRWALIVLESNYTHSGSEFDFSHGFFARMPEAYFILTSQASSKAAGPFLSTNTLENIYPIELMKGTETADERQAAIAGAREFLKIVVA